MTADGHQQLAKTSLTFPQHLQPGSSRAAATSERQYCPVLSKGLWCETSILFMWMVPDLLIVFRHFFLPLNVNDFVIINYSHGRTHPPFLHTFQTPETLTLQCCWSTSNGRTAAVQDNSPSAPGQGKLEMGNKYCTWVESKLFKKRRKIKKFWDCVKMDECTTLWNDLCMFAIDKC